MAFTVKFFCLGFFGHFKDLILLLLCSGFFCLLTGNTEGKGHSAFKKNPILMMIVIIMMVVAFKIALPR